MNDKTQTLSAANRKTNTLWAAVAVLAVAVVALGSSLFYAQSRQSVLHTAAVNPAPTPVAVEPLPAEAASPPAAPVEKKAAMPEAQKKTASSKPAVNRTAGTASSSTTQPALPTAAPAAGTPTPIATAPAKPVCLDCATVTAVVPIEREGEASGAGAVAGGVLGALVGNQFGGGDGKTLATIAGAVGGGIAGNTVEKKMKKVTVYRVDLRMDNGDLRSVEQATPASVGARVRLEGSTLVPLPAGN